MRNKLELFVNAPDRQRKRKGEGKSRTLTRVVTNWVLALYVATSTSLIIRHEAVHGDGGKMCDDIWGTVLSLPPFFFFFFLTHFGVV